MGVHSIPSDDTSRGKGVADAEAASTMEPQAPTSGEGSVALMWAQPESRGWDHPRVLWRSRDDPEGEPLFALEDAAEGGAGVLSSNTAVWRSGRCGQRCPSWLTICPGLPRCALSFLVLCRPFLSFLTVLDPYFAYPRARDPVPREIIIPPLGEARLGPARTTEGPARQCQQASISAEREGGGPPPSLCRYEL